MERKQRIVFTAVAVAGLLVYLTYTSLGGASYLSVSEVKATGDTGRLVRVNGTIVPGSSNWDPVEQKLTFKLMDESDVLDVVYRGNMPSNFQEGVPVVASGIYQEGVFQASDLLLKCPDKYKGSQAPV